MKVKKNTTEPQRMNNKTPVFIRSFSFGIIVLISLGMLAGCGITYPELTTDEYNQTVEYAAGLLLQYDKNYSRNLIDPEELRLMKPEPAVVPVAEVPAETVAGSNSEGGTAAEEEVVLLPLTEIIAMAGIDFQYAGFETGKEYPSAVTPGEVYSAMMASPNRDLLILNFDVVNNSGAEFYLDMLQREVRFRVGWNGGDMQNALTTLLLNELSSYRGNLAAGESVRLVVVSEIPEGSADGIFSIELSVRDNGITVPVSL